MLLQNVLSQGCSAPWFLPSLPWFACSVLGQDTNLLLTRFMKCCSILYVIHGTLPNISIPNSFFLLAILPFLLWKIHTGTKILTAITRKDYSMQHVQYIALRANFTQSLVSILLCWRVLFIKKKLNNTKYPAGDFRREMLNLPCIRRRKKEWLI